MTNKENQILNYINICNRIEILRENFLIKCNLLSFLFLFVVCFIVISINFISSHDKFLFYMEYAGIIFASIFFSSLFSIGITDTLEDLFYDDSDLVKLKNTMRSLVLNTENLNAVQSLIKSNKINKKESTLIADLFGGFNNQKTNKPNFNSEKFKIEIS